MINIIIKKLLCIPLIAVLLNSALAIKPTWDEIPEHQHLFGLGEYVAQLDEKAQELHLYTNNQGVLTEFKIIEHIAELPDYTMLNHTSYFILPKNGKYSIFSQDFSQLTPYKYNSVQFYGDFAIGVFAPDDASPVDLSAQTSELIDLKKQQVITSVKGHTINVSEDDHYFFAENTIYDATGNSIFQTDIAEIISATTNQAQDNILWIGCNNTQYAIYHNSTCVSKQYDDIEPYYIGKTQLFTAQANGTATLLDTSGREITQGADSITLLSSDLAAVQKNNSISYWNHSGHIRTFDQYSSIISLAGSHADLFDRVLVQTKNGKWGIMKQDGTLLVPPTFDSIKNAVQSNSIFQLLKENTIQIRNLDTNTLIPIPSNEELYVANVFNNNFQNEIACVSNLQNGLRIATLYNQSGTLLKNNIRTAFIVNGEIRYIQVSDTSINAYTESLTDGDGTILFTAPTGQMITQVTPAIICTTTAGVETTNIEHSFLCTDFTSATPNFSSREFHLANIINTPITIYASVLLIISVIIGYVIIKYFISNKHH